MECSEFREKVHDLIDLNVTPEERALLEKKEASCPCCRDAHESALRLKQLVERRVPRPEMPAELRARLRERLQHGRRVPLLRLAVAALVLVSVGLGIALVSGVGPHLSHAEAAQGATDNYRVVLADGPAVCDRDLSDAWQNEIATSHAAFTLAVLDDLPDTSSLRFSGHAPYRVGKATGVRLDFSLDPPPDGDPSDAVLVCLFVLDAKYVRLAEEPDKVTGEMRGAGGHECRCFELADETVLCLCRGSTLVNVVSSLDAARLREVLGLVSD